MKKQNNHISDERLSSYFDDEISASEKETIERHLKKCNYCRDRLSQFKQLHEISQQGPKPVLERDMWTSIDNQIDSLSNPDIALTSHEKWIAAAVIVLVVLTSGWFMLGDQIGTLNQDSLATTSVNKYAFDYGLYLSGLDNPELMKQFNDGYKRQKVELAGIGGSSAVLKNLPQDFSVESTYLLNSACCQCRQYTLQYNGKQITVFQQPKKHPAEFTGFHKKHEKIDSEDCSKIESDNHTALSFDSGDSKYVIVGDQQNPMISQIMSRLSKED